MSLGIWQHITAWYSRIVKYSIKQKQVSMQPGAQQVNVCDGAEAKQNALVVPYSSPEFATDMSETHER